MDQERVRNKIICNTNFLIGCEKKSMNVATMEPRQEETKLY